jgi:hypothetical protein
VTAWLITATFALLLAALCLPRRLRAARHPAPPAAQAALPAGAETRPEAQPRGEVTGPFGYDNGVTIGDAP